MLNLYKYNTEIASLGIDVAEYFPEVYFPVVMDMDLNPRILMSSVWIFNQTSNLVKTEGIPWYKIPMDVFSGFDVTL